MTGDRDGRDRYRRTCELERGDTVVVGGRHRFAVVVSVARVPMPARLASRPELYLLTLAGRGPGRGRVLARAGRAWLLVDAHVRERSTNERARLLSPRTIDELPAVRIEVPGFGDPLVFVYVKAGRLRVTIDTEDCSPEVLLPMTLGVNGNTVYTA